MQTFIFEFSEEQQCFHLNNGLQTPNSNGWRTIVRNVDEYDVTMFLAYFEAIKDRKKEQVSFDEVFKCFQDFKKFLLNLNESGLAICRI